MRQARQYKGLSQKEAAKQLHLNIRTYRSYEWGEREMRVGDAKNFSAIVGIPFENIIFYQKASRIV